MVRHTILALLVCTALCCIATDALTQHARKNPIVDAVAKTKASVVSIKAYSRNNAKPSIGTGVIIDERGYIVTNRHVVGAVKQIVVALNDKSEYAAKVVFADPVNDLAVLKIDADKKLPFLTLAPVSDLMVGETVVAVGNPFGFVNTVSVGIISALGRQIEMPNGETLTGLIQTDANINPGNSGGPLFNINGELIGIIVAIRDGAQGIAFAINAGTVRDLLSERLGALKIALTAPAPAYAEPRPKPPRILPARKAPEPTPTIAPDCKVTIDGKPARLEDLRPGMAATFVIERGVVVRIIATIAR